MEQVFALALEQTIHETVIVQHDVGIVRQL
jgi:hypothetical protein